MNKGLLLGCFIGCSWLSADPEIRVDEISIEEVEAPAVLKTTEGRFVFVIACCAFMCILAAQAINKSKNDKISS